MFLRETLCCEGIPTDVSYANPKDTNEIQMSAGSRGGALPSLGRRTRGFSSAAHLLQTLTNVTTMATAVDRRRPWPADYNEIRFSYI